MRRVLVYMVLGIAFLLMENTSAMMNIPFDYTMIDNTYNVGNNHPNNPTINGGNVGGWISVVLNN